MEKRLKITVKGKVQGVFYRKSTQTEAEKLGLKGTVRNLSNGDVFIEVEGDDDVVNQFVEWCWQGSERAMVEDVVIEQTEVQNFSDFKILH